MSPSIYVTVPVLESVKDLPVGTATCKVCPFVLISSHPPSHMETVLLRAHCCRYSRDESTKEKKKSLNLNSNDLNTVC